MKTIEPKPGDLIGIGHAGAGQVTVSVFIATYPSDGGNQLIRYYIIGSSQWRTLPEKLGKRWIWENSSYISGDYLQTRLILAKKRVLFIKIFIKK